MTQEGGPRQNPHFVPLEDWSGAGPLVDFRPLVPTHTAGVDLQALAVFVMDHRKREVPRSRRAVEAHYGDFVLSQSMPGKAEARRQALSAAYGAEAETVTVLGHEGRGYRRGPPVPDDDPDGRSPAVLVWADGPLFYLLASTELDLEVLVRIAESLRPRDP